MNLKRKGRNKSPPPIKICPKCHESGLKEALGIGGFIAPKVYFCNKCGYNGGFYLEVDPGETGEAMADLKKIQAEQPEDVEKESEITDYDSDINVPEKEK
jgi:hypothetical protein